MLELMRTSLPLPQLHEPIHFNYWKCKAVEQVLFISKFTTAAHHSQKTKHTANQE